MKHDSKRDKISEASLWRRIRELEAEVARLKLSQLVEGNATMDLIPELEGICMARQGYFRFGLAQNGQYWFRYKWTRDALEGRYEIGGHDTLAGAVWKLLDRYDSARAGKHVPPMDGNPDRIRR